MNRLLTFAMVLLASLTLVASASAATRYASPTGLASPDCLIGTPCDLTTAVNNTASGDEVILLGGTYDVAHDNSTIPGNYTAPAVTIRGESPFAPPLVRLAPTVPAIGFVVSDEVTLRDVRFSYLGANATSVALFTKQLAAVERVHVDAGPAGNAACDARKGTTFINTACIAHGDDAMALYFSIGTNSSVPTVLDFEASVRNSTFVATGESSSGVRIYAGNEGTDPLTQRLVSTNSIFEASAATSTDVVLETGWGANSSSVLVAQNSNFSSVTTNGPGTETFTPNDANGNQNAQPIFVNPSLGDVSQSSSSPTIDAGIDDPANGTLDLAAKPRTAGARTDIGAYEFQPPVVPGVPGVPAVPAPDYALSALTASRSPFRAATRGSTLRPASTRPKTKRGQKPIGSLLSFQSTDAGELRLHAFQVLKGRKSKTGKCGRPSRANARGKRCTYYKRFSRAATTAVTAGQNRFYFTGRWNSKKLRPGRYRLVAKHSGKGTSIPSPTAAEAGVARRTVTIVR